MRAAPHLIRVSRMQRVSNGAGGWTDVEVEIGTVRGRFGVIGAEEVEIARQMGEQIAASVRVPHGSDVAYDDRLVIEGHPGVTGSYRVDVVRPNPDHLRLMCSQV